MTTILKEIEISGNGLMKNKYCTVTLMPSREGCIRFFIKNSHNPVILDVDNVISTNHCVVLGNKKDKIMLTEHFTAACALSGIDSLDVHVTESEMPILDGSAKNWIEIFMQAGIERAKKEKVIIKEPIYYLNGKTHMVILPDDDLHITYAVNYQHIDLCNRWVSFDKKTVAEIISARTFGFLKDLKKYQLFGYAKGVTYENTVGLEEDGYTTKLRSPQEPIKHKILDLIGDLYLAGVNPLNLKAQIIVKEAGHAVHVKVAKALKESLLGISSETNTKNVGRNLSESRLEARAEIINRIRAKKLQETKIDDSNVTLKDDKAISEITPISIKSESPIIETKQDKSTVKEQETSTIETKLTSEQDSLSLDKPKIKDNKKSKNTKSSSKTKSTKNANKPKKPRKNKKEKLDE